MIQKNYKMEKIHNSLPHISFYVGVRKLEHFSFLSCFKIMCNACKENAYPLEISQFFATSKKKLFPKKLALPSKAAVPDFEARIGWRHGFDRLCNVDCLVGSCCQIQDAVGLGVGNWASDIGRRAWALGSKLRSPWDRPNHYIGAASAAARDNRPVSAAAAVREIDMALAHAALHWVRLFATGDCPFPDSLQGFLRLFLTNLFPSMARAVHQTCLLTPHLTFGIEEDSWRY